MDLAEGTVRDSGVIFHKIGIAEKDNDSGYKGWKMRTLSKYLQLVLRPVLFVIRHQWQIIIVCFGHISYWSWVIFHHCLIWNSSNCCDRCF